MKDLSKLDSTISELERQAKLLKDHNGVLAKVSDLASNIERSMNELTTGNKNFEAIKVDIQSQLKQFNEAVLVLDKRNSENIETIIKANKDFLRDLESGVTSRLERFSSDIQVAIRQERTQLQEVLLNNLTARFNDQNTLFEMQSRTITQLKYFAIATLSATAILLILHFVR